jgi:large subunit ribosomal protein L9
VPAAFHALFFSGPGNKIHFQYFYQLLITGIFQFEGLTKRSFFLGSRSGENLNGRRDMKVILLQDFASLGFEGDIVDVAKGYARNYLIPKGVVIEANRGNLKALEMRKDKIMTTRMKDKEAAESAKEKISQMTVTVRRKAGEDDKLYGSVTSRDIAQELEKGGIVVDRRKIIVDEAIRTVGEFKVPIKLHPEVMTIITVVVEREEEET